MKLKICQIRDNGSALRLVEAGVDYLGFHVLDESKIQEQARSAVINKQLRAMGFEGGVLLTKAHDLELNRPGVSGGRISWLSRSA